jgi:AraC-like DNA-binding protein
LYNIDVQIGEPWIRYGFLTTDFPVHEHLVWEFHAAAGGEACFLQGGRRDSLVAAQLVLSAPGQAHGIEVVGTFSFQYIRYDPDPADVAVLESLRRRQEAGGPLGIGRSGLERLAAVRRKLESGNASLRTSAILQFRAWLYELDGDPPGGGATVRPGGETDGTADPIVRTVAFMRAHLDRRLGLDELAGLAGLERSHYCRRFKRQTGLPPLAWFQRARIEAAGYLLADPDIPLAEIARRFAFADEFHFSKAFRAWSGLPPGRYRSRL